MQFDNKKQKRYTYLNYHRCTYIIYSAAAKGAGAE